MAQIHPRESAVKKAELSIRTYILETCKDLSEGEELQVLSNVLSSCFGGIAKYMIREERHPGEPDKPAGLA